MAEPDREATPASTRGAAGGRQRRWAGWLSFLALLGLAFRLAVVWSYPSASPDSHQYYALTESLLRDGRLAFDPPPVPLTHSRPPGYPLFQALLDGHPMPEAAHTLRAVTANALLDTSTALCLFALAALFHFGAAVGLVALALEFLFPPALLYAAYALTEPLATALGTAALLLACLPWRRAAALRWLAVGLVAGYALLVRIDMVTLLPALALLAWSRAADGQRRRLALGALGLGLLLTLGPWALRNQRLFGAPYLSGTEWSDAGGAPLPTGVLSWQRTWATGAPSDSALNGYVFFHVPPPPEIVTREMYDSRAERQRVIDTVAIIATKGLAGEADRRLFALATERRRAHPLRTFVTLPLRRIGQLFIPEPHGSFPLKIGWLGLPQKRRYFLHASIAVYLLALVGLVIAWRRGGSPRQFAKLALLVVGTRVLLYSFAVPHDVGQRKLIEVVPLILLLAAVGIVAPIRRLATRRL